MGVGKGTGEIAKGLMADEIPTGSGKYQWAVEDINRIISNEKYMGDVLLQKTYTVDCLTKQRVSNDGSVPQYYIEDNHNPIVSKEIFHLAQQEKARRSNIYSGSRKQKRLHQGKYALSGIVKCEHCGDIYRRVKWNSRGNKSTVWRCVTRIEDYQKCPGRTIKEEELHQAVMETLNQFIRGKESYLQVLQENVDQVISNECDKTVEEIDDTLDALQSDLFQAANRKEDYKLIAEQITKLRKQREEALINHAKQEEKRKRLSDIQAFLKTQHIELNHLEDSIVNRLVERVTILDESVEVELKTGESIRVDNK